MVSLKRAYDTKSNDDGQRFLVERLWPRGVKKNALKIAGWLRDVAPSTPLRKWFNHDPAKWEEFRKCYFAELDRHQEALRPLLDAARNGAVTLVYSSRDLKHNNAVALKEYLERELLRSRSPRKMAA